MHKDTLLTGEEMDELCGGNIFTVLSIPINEKCEAWDLKTPGILREDWPSESHAMRCARQRVEEGYRVHVSKFIAVSAGIM